MLTSKLIKEQANLEKEEKEAEAEEEEGEKEEVVCPSEFQNNLTTSVNYYLLVLSGNWVRGQCMTFAVMRA